MPGPGRCGSGRSARAAAPPLAPLLAPRNYTVQGQLGQGSGLQARRTSSSLPRLQQLRLHCRHGGAAFAGVAEKVAALGLGAQHLQGRAQVKYCTPARLPRPQPAAQWRASAADVLSPPPLPMRGDRGSKSAGRARVVGGAAHAKGAHAKELRPSSSPSHRAKVLHAHAQMVRAARCEHCVCSPCISSSSSSTVKGAVFATRNTCLHETRTSEVRIDREPRRRRSSPSTASTKTAIGVLCNRKRCFPIVRRCGARGRRPCAS
jgi:hypothetical protein